MDIDCPICFDHIVKKYMFSCNHCICKSCYRNMSKKGQTMIYDISMVHYPIIREFELKRIQCPLCRQDKFNKTQVAYINALNECFPGFIE
jgi:hypothetical protein